jgi:hypothetical protein
MVVLMRKTTAFGTWLVAYDTHPGSKNTERAGQNEVRRGTYRLVNLVMDFQEAGSVPSRKLPVTVLRQHVRFCQSP